MYESALSTHMINSIINGAISMPRRKTNAVPRLTKTVNVRVPSILDAEIRAECRRHDLPVSHFGRKSFEFFLDHIRQRSNLYDAGAIV